MATIVAASLSFALVMASEQTATDGAEGALMDPAMLGESLVPLLKKTVEDVLAWIGPHVGETVTDLMTNKFPSLKNFDHLVDKAKELAETIMKGKHDDIMQYVHQLGGHLEENFPKLGSILLQATKNSVGDTVDGLLQYVKTWCSCCYKPKAEDVKEKAFDTVSGEVKEIIKTKLKTHEDQGFTLHEHATKMIHDKLSPMVDAFAVNASLSKPAAASAPASQTMTAP